ncbi:MAG: hypothetical protein IT578_10915 [Verrucomicrobiae bacterium]|nr:hypothetical protein [Verrucomicrobiae bacterium]
MKPKLTLLSVSALAFAFALAAPILRGEEAAGGAVPVAEKPAKAARIKYEKAVGAIENLDVEAKSITVAGKTYKVANAAKVLIDGAKKTLADLQVGDTVTVRYLNEADGVAVAKGIQKGAAKKRVKTSPKDDAEKN